jgi:hypothetical protein
MSAGNAASRRANSTISISLVIFRLLPDQYQGRQKQTVATNGAMQTCRHGNASGTPIPPAGETELEAEATYFGIVRALKSPPSSHI